jgi:hypothetical protein
MQKCTQWLQFFGGGLLSGQPLSDSWGLICPCKLGHVHNELGREEGRLLRSQHLSDGRGRICPRFWGHGICLAISVVGCRRINFALWFCGNGVFSRWKSWEALLNNCKHWMNPTSSGLQNKILQIFALFILNIPSSSSRLVTGGSYQNWGSHTKKYKRCWNYDLGTDVMWYDVF